MRKIVKCLIQQLSSGSSSVTSKRFRKLLPSQRTFRFHHNTKIFDPRKSKQNLTDSKITPKTTYYWNS